MDIRNISECANYFKDTGGCYTDHRGTSAAANYNCTIGIAHTQSINGIEAKAETTMSSTAATYHWDSYVDVSQFIGEYYIVIANTVTYTVGGSSSYFKVSKMWLE